MPATLGLLHEKQPLSAVRAGEKRLTDKRVNLLSQVALQSILQTCVLLKGKQQLAPVPPYIRFPLAQRQLPPKSDNRLELPASSNFRFAKPCLWGGSPSKGALSKRHSRTSYLNKLQQALPCTSKSSSHPPCLMLHDKCHLSSH